MLPQYSNLKGMTFQQFLESVLAEEKINDGLRFSKMDLHWRPIVAHGFFCYINYTVISKMETYSEDKGRFLEMLGITEMIKEERLHVHGGESIQDKTKFLFKDIKEEVRVKVKEVYKYDLEMFDYDPNKY